MPHNHLRYLPTELCCLTNLANLNLMCNQLEELPERFGDLTGLKLLGLKSNRWGGGLEGSGTSPA